jgi:hypothetical protein
VYVRWRIRPRAAAPGVPRRGPSRSPGRAELWWDAIRARPASPTRLAPSPWLQKERRIAHGSENPGGKT